MVMATQYGRCASVLWIVLLATAGCGSGKMTEQGFTASHQSKLESLDSTERRDGAETLSKTRYITDELAPLLIDLMRNDADAKTRVAAAETLAFYYDQGEMRTKIVQSLREAVKTENDDAVSRAIAASLRRLARNIGPWDDV